ncbi:MAG: methyltransferase domain-containing protein [Patescibacteria group bacterium]|nr:methyltransferase domain-containing protein [Patescibacteria group bacterium]
MKDFLISVYEYGRRVLGVTRRNIRAPKFPANPDGKILVNVGCGGTSGPGFVNIDVLKLPNIHHIHDITSLDMLGSNTVDLLYASHVLEHIPRSKLDSTLKEWRRVLKKGGKLRISVPDFDNLVMAYQESGRDISVIRDQVLGQEPPYDNHYTLWNYRRLQEMLTELSFVNIRRWDPSTVSHHDFTDRSSRLLMVGDKQILLSLNVEADKV